MPPCDAPAGTSAASWLSRGIELLPTRPEQAYACFSDAAAADPLSHEAPLQLGLAGLSQLYRDDGSIDSAEVEDNLFRAARLALRHDRNTSSAMKALRSIGEVRSNAADWAGAEEAYALGLAVDATDCVMSANLAHAQAARGRIEAAASTLRAALAEDHACVLAHHGLAKLLGHLGDLPSALRHVRAALELRPFDEEYEETLRELEGMGVGGGAIGDGDEAADGGDDGDGSATGEACGAAPGWAPPPLPTDLAPPASCDANMPASKRPLLLINPFEEGCFHDDLRTNVRQQYHSCGQFNNVLASLLQALALSRLLCRTLILPGFFVRFGTRLTRVSPFAERWLPTSHFFNLTTLRSAFDVIELREWLREGSRRTLPKLLIRSVGGSPAQLRFFEFLNLSFSRVQPATFPHFLQQQSELRWVSDTPDRGGYFSHFKPGYAKAFWHKFADEEDGRARHVLAFDAAPSAGMQMDHLRWDEALRYTRGHLRYVGRVHAEASRVVRSLFGREPYLAVHIRRGADRLHDFCHTSWGQRCFGWNITDAMCYPPTESVAHQILEAQRRWKLSHVFLATDSPRPELFEDVLRAHGVRFARYGQQGPRPALGDEFALPVDQTVCAAAPYFLGNVPSTVTATIVQERDSMGWERERTHFFGFGESELAQFRREWQPSDDFAPHYSGPGGCTI